MKSGQVEKTAPIFNVLPAPDEEERDSVSRQRGSCKYSNRSDPGR